ncbi:MAG: GGDEF domain-containing protein [Thermocrinis sp.]|jgi:diguanylate cyclase (GGDEF)-like protein|uniref:GGDEF domain-containing protein n=1 Tax=Thermocrinis sp. TaxID=2024383 RepID=UPI003BFAFC12
MLKRRVLLRIIVSFLITFLPTVVFLFYIFQRISQDSLIKERDILYNNSKSLLERELKGLEPVSTLPKSPENKYYIAFKINGNCTGGPYYWLTTDSIYYGKNTSIGNECWFVGVNFVEFLEVITGLNEAEWLILYNRDYIEKFPQEFLDSFVKGIMFKDKYVIVGMSKQAVLNIPLDTRGYAVYGKLWKKNLVVEFPLLDSKGFPIGKVLFIKDVSQIYINFYVLMGILSVYSFALSLLSSLLLYVFSENLVDRIIKLQKLSSVIKEGNFSRIELLKTEKPKDELDYLRNNLVDTAFTIGRLLSELEEKNRELQELAYYDPLTGLPNRRFFFEHASLIFEEVKRYEKPLSLLVMDIDHFKKINDTYGHDAGDLVLKTFADVIRGIVRKSDICARFGGEEFVVLLPNTDLEGAGVLAERIRAAVSKNPVEHGSIVIVFTVSIGISQYRKGMQSIDELIKEADIALYRAKEGGRNRVEVFIPNETAEPQN